MLFPALKKTALALWQQYHPKVVAIEDNGTGTALIQELRKNRVPIWPFKPKDSKAVRADAQGDKIVRGRVYLYRQAPWLEDFLAEIAGFPNGRYDNEVDSMVQYLTWIDERAKKHARSWQG